MWGQLQQPRALADRLEDQGQLGLLQVAQAAVNELGRLATGTGGKVVLLDQRDLEPPQRRVARNACPRDTTANDEQVEYFALKVLPRNAPRNRGHDPLFLITTSLVRCGLREGDFGNSGIIKRSARLRESSAGDWDCGKLQRRR